jgi:hypothetical protein
VLHLVTVEEVGASGSAPAAPRKAGAVKKVKS